MGPIMAWHKKWANWNWAWLPLPTGNDAVGKCPAKPLSSLSLLLGTGAFEVITWFTVTIDTESRSPFFSQPSHYC